MIPAYTEHDSHQYVSHHRPGSPVCQERTVIPHIHNPEIIQEISSHLNQKCCRTPCSHQHSELISLSEGYPQETEQQEQEKPCKEYCRKYPVVSCHAGKEIFRQFRHVRNVRHAVSPADQTAVSKYCPDILYPVRYHFLRLFIPSDSRR